MKNNPITFLRHLAAPLLLLGATSLFAATGTQTLRNDKLQISIDKDGRLVSLRNLETGRDYAGNDFLWRLYYDTQKAKEIEVLPERQAPHVSSDGKTITLSYNELKATDFSTREEVTLHMRLRLDLSLEGDLIHCASTIENNEPHTIIREFHYPLVGNMPLPEDHKLLLTHTGGQLYDDPKGIILRNSNSSPYKTPAQKFRQMDAKYPMRTVTGGTGGCMASNCFAYVGERATVIDSVLLPGAVVKDGANVVRAILGENAVVEENVSVGSVDTTKDTAVIGNDVVVGKGEN